MSILHDMRKEGLTFKHNSSGKCSNGSFFSLGDTKADTKLSWLLLHMFNISAKHLCRSASLIDGKCSLMIFKKESSFSPAEAQLGALWNGPGDGAGVGGEAGAEGITFAGSAGRTDRDILF